MLISPHGEDRCASFHHWPLGASGSLVPEGAVTHTSQGPVVIKLSPSGGDQRSMPWAWVPIPPPLHLLMVPPGKGDFISLCLGLRI